MLYFDHSATTPPYKEVVEVVAEVMDKYYGNPSSLHRLGAEAENLVRKARQVISDAFGVKPENIIFTSGGTESNNLAIKGIAMQYRHRGNHLITTPIEHASVYECFRQLEQMGFRVTYVPVDSTGQVSVEEIRRAITDETILVSVMHVNNEMGRIQNVEQIGRMLREYPRVFFHVDAVQSVGKLQVEPARWGIDLMSVSAHKIRGPKGIGFLYRRGGIRLHPLLAGGGQEFGLRAGTENVPLIVGMAKAVRLTMENRDKHAEHLYRLRKRLVEHIQNIPELVLTGPADDDGMAPHIVHFCYPGMKSEIFIHSLEKHKIYASTRSACSSGEEKPSRVLKAMGYDDERAASGVRISFSPDQSMEHIDFLGEQLRKVVEKLKPVRSPS